MTTKKDLKQLVRARMGKTGESYTAALRHVRDGDAARAPTEHQVERVYSHSLFPYLRDGHTTLVPEDSPEYGPYASVRVVPDAEVGAGLASGKWREVTEAELNDALDAEFSAFEDYGSEHEFFS